MRTPLAIATGIVIGVASAAVVYLAVERPRPQSVAADRAASLDQAQPSSPLDAASRSDDERKQTAAPPRSSRALPVTPAYGPVPDAARPIYRCTSRGGVEYSNQPCAGATVIAEPDAVGGYDSRPSDRVAQLVADGRAADAIPPVPTRSGTPRVGESVECANFRRQIADIDAATLRPTSQRSLDEWRRIREDIRTSMARSRC